MTIYEFTFYNSDKKIRINEITDLRETKKCYIGKGIRILKDDIDKIQGGTYSKYMYSLNNDTSLFIDKIVEKIKKNIVECDEKKSDLINTMYRLFDLKE